MACCGKMRSQFRAAAPRRPLSVGRTTVASPPDARPLAYFEYFGPTGLTAIGPVTGRRYRFEGRGARVAIDQRDASGMLAVPNLRRV